MARADVLAWLVVIVTLFAGCAAPASQMLASENEAALPAPLLAGDALLALGALDVARVLYDFGDVVHRNEERASAYVLPLRGSLHAPTQGDGPFPVVVFQHGRHGTCAVGPMAYPPTARLGILGPAGQCHRAAPVTTPVDSYTGYDYLAEHLASHGFVVASVDTNGVNDLDGFWSFAGTNRDAGAAARADILLRTLDELAALNATSDGSAVGELVHARLDLGRVGLMGHSRGGEGVTYAIHENLARPEAQRHAIRAVFALAPIDANSVTAPDVAFATLLPYCDGDVSSLSGARIFDASRALAGEPSPKSQIVVLGANHNYYNSLWTEDDAFWLRDDPHCGSDERLTPEEQRAQGLAHIAGFLRLHLAGETAFAPLFDGTATLPEEACPAALPCGLVAHTSYVPPAADRLALEGAVRAEGFTRDDACAPRDCETDAYVTGSATRRVLAWSGSATYSIEGAWDASGFDALVLRAAAEAGAPENAGSDAQDVRIEVMDAAGTRGSTLASHHSRALFVPPGGEDARKVVLNDVRVPLAAFAGLDLARVVEVRLVFDATPTGALHVGDAMLVR